MGGTKKRTLKYMLMRRMPHSALRAALAALESRHNFVVRRIRRNLGMRASGLDPDGIRRSDTVFLLGSGSSINDITQQRWNGIAACDSMALNFWLRHPFVPTVYFFEAPAPPVFNRLNKLVWQRQQDYKGVVKIITTVSTVSPYFERQFEQLPESWRREVYPLDAKTMFARNDHELRREIMRLQGNGLFTEDGTVTQLFKYMGTITSMISLAARMGYRNIVLCGVDLSDSGYFHQDERLYPDMKGFRSSARKPRHEMMGDETPHCGSDQVIEALRDLVLAPRGISLYVENPKSALYPAIEQAPDSLFKIDG